VNGGWLHKKLKEEVQEVNGGWFHNRLKKHPIGERHSASESACYRGPDKALTRPGRKQATATEDFDVHVSYLLS